MGNGELVSHYNRRDTSRHQRQTDDDVEASVVIGTEAPVVEEREQIDLAILTGTVEEDQLAQMRAAAADVRSLPKTNITDGTDTTDTLEAGDTVEIDGLTVRVCGANEVGAPTNNPTSVGGIAVETESTVAVHVTENLHGQRGEYTRRVLDGLEDAGVENVDRVFGPGKSDIEPDRLPGYESEQDSGRGGR